MKPRKKPPGKGGLIWKVLTVIGVAVSAASLILTIVETAR